MLPRNGARSARLGVRSSWTDREARSPSSGCSAVLQEGALPAPGRAARLIDPVSTADGEGALPRPAAFGSGMMLGLATGRTAGGQRGTGRARKDGTHRRKVRTVASIQAASTFTPHGATMDTDSLHFLGRLGKPWGHQGELTVHLEEVDLDEIVARRFALRGHRRPARAVLLQQAVREGPRHAHQVRRLPRSAERGHARGP